MNGLLPGLCHRCTNCSPSPPFLPAAVQFVLSDSLPTSSYVVPTQQVRAAVPSSRHTWQHPCARERCGPSGQGASGVASSRLHYPNLALTSALPLPPACALPVVSARPGHLHLLVHCCPRVHPCLPHCGASRQAAACRGALGRLGSCNALARAAAAPSRAASASTQASAGAAHATVRKCDLPTATSHPGRSAVPAVPQRRREAYRRYCKLRDQGKLAGGANPPLSAADTVVRLPTVNGQGFSDDEAPAAVAGRPGSPRYDSVEEGASKPWAAANGSPPTDSGAAPGALAGAPTSPPAEPFDAPASPPPPRRRFGLFGGGFFCRPNAATVRLSELSGAVSV